MEKWKDWTLTAAGKGVWRYEREILKAHPSEMDNFYFTPEEKRHIIGYLVTKSYPTKLVTTRDSYSEEIDFDAPCRITHRIDLDTELEQLVRELPSNEEAPLILLSDLQTDPSGFYIKDGVLLEFVGKYTDPFVLPPISEIGYKAFKPSYSLLPLSAFPGEVVLPNGLKKIGDRAFARCEELRRITIPDSVVHIGEGAFWGSRLDEGVTLPKGIERIEARTFRDTKLKSITIPDGVKSIGDEAFMNCGALKSAEIPDSVEEIGKHAFTRCRSLKDIKASPKITELIKGMRKYSG